MTWNRNEPFVREKPIVAFVDGVETPNSIMLSNSRVTANAAGKKAVDEGVWISRIGSAFHVLPRGTVTTGFTTSSPNGVITMPRFFQPGDLLTVVEAHQIITFSNSWTTGSSIQVTLPSGTVRNIAYGSGGSTAVTLANVATITANTLNADPIASNEVFAIALASKVYVYNKKGNTAPEFAIASGTNGSDFAVADIAPFTTLGTISTINATSGAVVLTGNAAIAAPVGAHVGVVVDEVYGIYPHAMDLTSKPKFAIAPVSGAHGIYENSLPYCDGELKARFPKLRIAAKF